MVASFQNKSIARRSRYQKMRDLRKLFGLCIRCGEPVETTKTCKKCNLARAEHRRLHSRRRWDKFCEAIQAYNLIDRDEAMSRLNVKRMTFYKYIKHGILKRYCYNFKMSWFMAKDVNRLAKIPKMKRLLKGKTKQLA